jgi:hypothetical protein
MGTIKQGILGGFSGKVGTVVGGSWKGISYMRGKAASISNPKTAAQLDQRAKFATALGFLQPLTPFVRVGFKNYAVGMTAFNAAMAYNLANAVYGEAPEYFIVYADALVSRGKLPTALNPHVSASVPGEVQFTWENNSQESTAMADDQVLLVLYNHVKKQAVTVVAGNTRASGSQSVTVPESFVGDELNCFIAFQNAGQTIVSNSIYIGETVVL